MTARRESEKCRWCGEPVKAGAKCSTCADLDELDAEARGDARPLTERELGMPPTRPVGDREGRRELY